MFIKTVYMSVNIFKTMFTLLGYILFIVNTGETICIFCVYISRTFSKSRSVCLQLFKAGKSMKERVCHLNIPSVIH